jgi:hypothetical protein
LVEEEEDSGATILPKVAAAEIAGGGRNRRATARAIRVHRRARGREMGEEVRPVWVGLTDPELGWWGWTLAEWAGPGQWAKAHFLKQIPEIHFQFKSFQIKF